MAEQSSDFDTMLTIASELARKMVDQFGMAAPFAVVVHEDGTTRTIAAESKERSPRIVELVDGLMRWLRKEAPVRGFRSVLICSTGYAARPATGEQARAILMGMETRDGECRNVAIPFSRGLYGSYVFHEPIEDTGRLIVFAPDDSGPGPWPAVSFRRD